MANDIQPVTGPQVWRAGEIASRSGWIFPLGEALVRAAGGIVREAGARGLTQDTFDFEKVDIPALREMLAPVAAELARGSGLALIRGIDVESFTVEELKLLFLLAGNHMGLIGPQDIRTKGIGEVMDVNPPEGNRYYYHVGGPLPMHMDPVDIVGLLGVRKANRGGESQIVSSMAVHNEILRTRPDLLEILYRGFRQRRREHRRGGGSPLTDYYCPVFADIGGEVVCNYIPAPIRMAVEDGIMTLTALEEEALDVLERTAEREDLCLTMDIEPGDIQFLNNRVILHGRKDYEDFGDQPEQRRLLLRIWLTMKGWRKFPANMPHTDVELMTEPA